MLAGQLAASDGLVKNISVIEWPLGRSITGMFAENFPLKKHNYSIVFSCLVTNKTIQLHQFICHLYAVAKVFFLATGRMLCWPTTWQVKFSFDRPAGQKIGLEGTLSMVKVLQRPLLPYDQQEMRHRQIWESADEVSARLGWLHIGS